MDKIFLKLNLFRRYSDQTHYKTGIVLYFPAIDEDYKSLVPRVRIIKLVKTLCTLYRLGVGLRLGNI